MPVFFYLPLWFAAAAHGGGPAIAPPPGTGLCPTCAVTACVAVARADVQHALGRTVKEGEPSSDGASSSCDYVRGNGRVTITIQRLKAKPNVEAEIENLRRSIPEATVRDAPGIGRRAFFLDIAGAGAQLYVISGDYDFVMISVLGFGEAAQVSTAAETMAREALKRL